MRPALRSRLAFYLWSHRVGPEYDAWVRSQIERPSYAVRQLVLLWLPVAVVVVVFALARDAVLTGVVPVLALSSAVQLFSAGTRERRTAVALQRHRLLPSGPVLPVWHPTGRLGGAVLLSLIATVTTGVVVVGEDLEDRLRCPRVPSSVADELRALVADESASVPPWKGASLRSFRQVSIGEGQHVVAALVRLRGEDFGPATWRTLDPHSPLNESDRLRVEAVPGLAAEITPSLGTYSQDPLPYDAIRATNCVV